MKKYIFWAPQPLTPQHLIQEPMENHDYPEDHDLSGE